MSWSIDAGLAGTSFTLTNVGDTHSVTFGRATMSEEQGPGLGNGGQISAGERVNLGVAGVLNLTAPGSSPNPENNIAVVVANQGAFNDANTDLSATFASLLVNFSGGQFSVDLSDPSWNCTSDGSCLFPDANSETITATFTLEKLDAAVVQLDAVSAAVPEPATLALMGLGIAGLGLRRRKR